MRQGRRQGATACALRSVGLVASVVTILAYGYRRYIRDCVVNWGATPEEVSERFPGDALLEDAELIATRGITIHARPSAIWPWLLQMGVGRGGAYTYDWI
jgi:hypothetical protein